MASQTYVTIPGLAAHSTFRLEELEKNANAILKAKGVDATVERIRSLFVHYVCPQSKDVADVLDKKDSRSRQILEQLLHYGDPHSPLNKDQQTQDLYEAALGKVMIDSSKSKLLVWVNPRKGTISPWSSKATSIAQVCELGDEVERIERGILYSVTFNREFDASSGLPFADVLHDRMTEVFIQRPFHSRPSG